MTVVFILYFIFLFISFGLLLLYLFQDKILYVTNPFNTRYVFDKPERFRLYKWEDVFIDTIDGEKIHAWLIKTAIRSESAPTMLYFHGNAGNISHRLCHINQVIKKLGMNVFIVEYRGYGKSTGSPDEIGLQNDAQASLDYLIKRKDIDKNKIVCFGRSLGGAVAIDLTIRNQSLISGLMIENTFTTIPSMITKLMPFLFYFKYLSKNQWNSIDKIKHISKDKPVLFLCGFRDELVPHSMMLELYENCPSLRKTIKIYKDGCHNSTWACEGYNDDINSWLKNENIKNNDSVGEFFPS